MTTTIEKATRQDTPAAAGVEPMSVVLKRTEHGPELARLPVTEPDLMDGCSELWSDHWLRRGRPDVAMDRLRFRSTPLVADGSAPRCEGIAIEAEGPDGELVRRNLPTAAVHDIELRGVEQLIKAGILKEGQK